MKEIEIELADDAATEQVISSLETAIGTDTVLWLTDRKGRRVGIPAARVAYVEIGAPASERRVGFGAA